MAALGTYLENAILNFWFRANPGSLTSPATVYLALCTTASSAAGLGTEPGAPYARQALALTAPSGGSSNNSSPIFFSMPACTVTHCGVMDASTGGNILLWGVLTTSVTCVAGLQLTIPTGDVIIALS